MGNRSTLQMVALVFGAIYLAAGVLGFLPLAGGSYTLTVHGTASPQPTREALPAWSETRRSWLRGQARGLS